MYNTFLSVVAIVHHPGQFRLVIPYLKAVTKQLRKTASDYEIILVNNAQHALPEGDILELEELVRRHLFLLNLASATNKNNAIIAGLDRANGDYALIFDLALYQQSEYIHNLFEKSQEGYDMVYLRSPTGRRLGLGNRLFYKIFYRILRRYSPLRVDERAYDSRIISRRALNSLLKLRENVRYLKAIYSIVGYQTIGLDLEKPLSEAGHEPFGERFKTSLVAISSFTTFLRAVLLWIFLASSLFAAAVVLNALRVYFYGKDLFGNPEQAVEGWTFLVVLISVFFTFSFLTLYIMSVYLSNIYQEIKQRPLYIIESVKRF